MQIKSIKKIVQVGIFTDLDARSKRFEKLTILYGFNTHGKTTLCDILQSLSENNSKIIESRRTIPITRAPQIIEISYKNGDGEKSVYFRNRTWETSDLGEHIVVFGTDFIHKNVFTGLAIERKNKENFTDFILGEEGVSIANTLQKTNHEIRVLTHEFSNSVPPYVLGKSPKDISEFIDLEVDDDENTIKTNIEIKTAELVSEKEKLNSFDEIINKNEPKPILKTELRKILVLLRYTNRCLKFNYEQISDSALKKLREHISKNFIDSNNAENWIKTGLAIGNVDEKTNCPFCGQELKNALELLHCYKNYFNEQYIQFVNNIENALYKALNKLENVAFNHTREIVDNLLIIKEYTSLITDNKFTENLKLLEELNDTLTKEDKDIQQKYKNIVLTIREKTKNKKQAPHQRIDVVEYSNIKNLIVTYVTNYKHAELLINYFIAQIESFKKEYNTDTINQKISNIVGDLDILNKNKARLEQDFKCRKYKELQTSLKNLRENKEKLSKQLEQSQSVLIDKYFTKINCLFKELGSNDFTLQKQVDPRGNKKVYSISVKYKNQKITNDQLPYVFSESDRRALALAIFWTKLYIKNDKAKTIVVFDDPIASFDDNRITRTINLLKTSIEQLNQVIVSTHYPNFVTRFLEITKDKQIPYKIFHVKKTINNCEFCEVERQDFLLDNHEKRFLKIYDFINRKNDIDIRSELRPYLENHLKRLFCKQILDMGLDKNNLESLIDGLYLNQLITESQKEKLHEFRRTLNPDSHILTSNNIEDVRHFALGMISFLHGLSFQ